MSWILAEDLTKQVNATDRDKFIAEHSGIYLLLDPRSVSEAFGSVTYAAYLEEDEEARPAGRPKGISAHPLSGKDKLNIGRAQECDIQINDGSISKVHACFVLKPSLQLIDLGSQNGTFVDGKALLPNQPRALQAGMTLRFGVLPVDLVDGGRLYDLVLLG
jgi:hypothetical protein